MRSAQTALHVSCMIPSIAYSLRTAFCGVLACNISVCVWKALLIANRSSETASENAFDRTQQELL